MKITLKLYALLTEYLPPDAKRHAVEMEVDDVTTPEQIIHDLGIPYEMTHLVLLNGIFLEHAERNQPVLKNGDTLAIWPPVAGG